MPGKIASYRHRSTTSPANGTPIRRWPCFADLPQSGETLHAGQPVVTVLAHADSSQSVTDQLSHRIATIEKLLADS